MQYNIQNVRKILEKKGNNHIVPIPTLNASEIDLTCSLLVPHCSFESSISQGILFSALQWEHDPFLPRGCMNHNNGHQVYESRKSPARFLKSAHRSTKGPHSTHVAMLNDTYPSATMTQFFSSTLDLTDPGIWRNQQYIEVEGFRNIAPHAKPMKAVTGSMVRRRIW